ncbi:MAG TPA: adenosylcobinamide amidohydrolase [Acidimicrobiales bacterium]|nr:adenosylcobinamide amidohydrolase [Acidimicrobiales bacterium]
MRSRLQTHTTTDRVRPALVWRSPAPFLAASSAPFGGGMARRTWIVNAEVPSSYDRVDLAQHAAELQTELGLRGDGIVLLTAASVEKHTVATDGEVVATATVGLTAPTWAAAPDGDAGAWRPGTINIVCWVPVRLALSALVGAVATVTEAKVQALLGSGVDGTGTPSDAVCIACPADGPVEAFAGVRARWGAPLARAAHDAVAAGVPEGR